MSSEIILGDNYHNYDDFQRVNFIFSQIFISLFCGLFNGKTHKNASHDAKFLHCIQINGHKTRYFNQLDKGKNGYINCVGKRK
jgi:hypothetical protein